MRTRSVEYVVLGSPSSFRDYLWSIPWQFLQEGYYTKEERQVADLLVTIERLVTKGLGRGLNVLISPWLGGALLHEYGQ